MRDIIFRGKDSPSANGRRPRIGDVAWTVSFPLDDGRTLHIELGRSGYESFRDMLLQSADDDAKEAAHE